MELSRETFPFWKNVVWRDSTEPETVIEQPLIYNEGKLKGGKLVFVRNNLLVCELE